MSLRVGILIEGSIWSAADRLQLSCSTEREERSFAGSICQLSVSLQPWTKNRILSLLDHHMDARKINWAGKSVNLK